LRARSGVRTAHRIDGLDDLPLTHKLLGIMLAVQRPAATTAIQTLERQGLIRAGRRSITVRNRKGLINFSKGACVTPP